MVLLLRVENGSIKLIALPNFSNSAYSAEICFLPGTILS